MNYRSNIPAIPGSQFKLPGGERAVASNGEFNAYDKKDLVNTINQLVAAAVNGKVSFNETSPAEKRKTNELKKAVLASAYADRATGNWAVLGSDMATSISETADREGFMRRLLNRADVSTGTVPRMRVRTRNVTAITTIGLGATRPQLVRDNWIYLPEFQINANVSVDQNDINQGTADILDEKYLEAQQSIMVNEDRVWKNMADATVGMDYSLQILSGGLTLANLTKLVNTDMGGNNLQPVHCVMSISFWTDLIGDLVSKFEPVTNYEILQTGRLGSLLGVTFITDGFRHPQLRVLDTNELYLVAAPEYHGAYFDRGPVESVEVDGRVVGTNSRGWFMTESVGAALANPKSVLKAKKA